MTLRLLVANPNTSADITEKMATTARAIAGPRAAILPDTAPFGASALETEADLAVAADAVAAMLRRADCDGAIIAAFGDPGLKAARAAAPMPVVGLGESGLIVAGEGGRPFAVLTLGPALKSAIEAKVAGLGLGAQLVGIEFLPAGVRDVAAAPERFFDAILAEAEALHHRGAAAVLLGGAPFSGLAKLLSERSALPLVDGLTSAVERLLTILGV